MDVYTHSFWETFEVEKTTSNFRSIDLDKNRTQKIKNRNKHDKNQENKVTTEEAEPDASTHRQTGHVTSRVELHFNLAVTAFERAKPPNPRH